MADRYHLEGILEEFKILPHPHSLMKVTWNDGSQGVVGGNTMEVPTCYLLRDVSADPFLITTSPVSEAS